MKLILVACTLSLAAGPAFGQTDTQQIAESASPAVVVIRAAGPAGGSTGSGFIVEPTGAIVTSLHVIEGATTVSVKLANGDVYDRATVRAFDRRRDLAILQIPARNLPTLKLGDSDSVQVGEPVVLIGSPLGLLEASVSTGVVSGLRSIDGFKVIQTDTAANPGNSGGPLINASGEAIGVLSFKLREAENLNFAVPIDYAAGLLSLHESFDLEELNSQLRGASPDLFDDNVPARKSTRWRSLTSGSVKVVREAGDHIYVETELSEETRKAGAFVIADLSRDGDAFSGTQRNRFACTYTAADWAVLGTKEVVNWCTIENRLTIRSISPDRIEGVAEGQSDNAKFDCKKCTFREAPAQIPFVWIPE